MKISTLTNDMSKSLIDSILPPFGTRRAATPIWDEGQKMFLCDQYESASGNRSYKGVRFCNNLAIVEVVGLYHTITYINSILVYAFNGNRTELVQKRDYVKTFRSEAFIREETKDMVRDYLKGMFKIQGGATSDPQLAVYAKELVDKSYKSFLDADYNVRLTQVLNLIEQK